MQEGLSGGVSALHIPNPEAGEDVPTHHISEAEGLEMLCFRREIQVVPL